MNSLRSPAAGPLDDDDLLSEILLRLPPQPSSLPRASAVCKLWHNLLSDTRFLRRFRIRHSRNPAPLLGCFSGGTGLSFTPALGAPNRVPPERFSLQIDDGDRLYPHGCRHGLLLLSDLKSNHFLVWDPVTGDRHRVVTPPGFEGQLINGAVLRAMGDVHFKLLLLLDESCCFTVVRAQGGGLGFLSVSKYAAKARIWKRKTDCDGVVSWGLGRTIELDKLLSLNSKKYIRILGYAEENNLVFMGTPVGFLMVHLQSWQVTRLSESILYCPHHPFESLYIEEKDTGGRHDGAEIPHNA